MQLLPRSASSAHIAREHAAATTALHAVCRYMEMKDETTVLLLLRHAALLAAELLLLKLSVNWRSATTDCGVAVVAPLLRKSESSEGGRNETRASISMARRVAACVRRSE